MTSDGEVGAPRVAIVDYGIGNLHSAQQSFSHMGADAVLTSDVAQIAAADSVVLPGVGAFGACMTALRERDLEGVVLDAVASGRPFMGICVGTQMLFDGSDEDTHVTGLGVFPGRVEWLSGSVKRPQMQWNRLSIVTPDPVLAGLDDEAWLYFVHSLHGMPDDPALTVATCDYGGTVNAAFRHRNVFAAQFHPEKSGPVGLAIIANFVAESRAAVGAK